MTTPPFWEEATTALSKRDPVLAKLIASYHGETLTSRGDAFYTLARSIAGQQISVKAADSVWRKLLHAIAITPQALLSASVEDLRACGLSQQKIRYLKEIATHFDTKREAVALWPSLSDELLIKELVALKGVGRWTAEMMLIFHYQRSDVFPVADLGLLKAISLHYPHVTGKDAALALAETWRPWRTVATWYLWRALDPLPVEY